MVKPQHTRNLAGLAGFVAVVSGVALFDTRLALITGGALLLVAAITGELRTHVKRPPRNDHADH